MRRWIWIGLGGCGDPSDEDCLSRFSVENGYGFASDGGETAVAPPTDTAAPADAPTGLDQAIAECTAEGADDCEVVVTREAAECIAAEGGLAPGVADWRTSLVFHHTHNAIVWNVMSTASQTGATASGSSVTIHAESGEVLAESQWSAMP